MLGRRILSQEEKMSVLERYHYQCYICRGDIIHPDESEFVHKLPLNQGGTFDLTNYVPLHDYCFLKAKEQDLSFARDENQIDASFAADFDKIFTSKKSDPHIQLDTERMTATVGDEVVPLYQCDNTGTWYFYHQIPASCLEADAAIDPEGITKSRVVQLTGHLREHVQLYPVVCRWQNGHLLIVSGLHRAVAQILGNNHLRVDCKVLVEPNEAMVGRAVAAARGQLRTTPRKPAPLTEWLFVQFRDEINQWRDIHPQSELTEAVLFYEILQLKETQAVRSLESFQENWMRKTEPWQVFAKEMKSRSVLLPDGMSLQLSRYLMQNHPAGAVLESEQDYRQEEAKNCEQMLQIIFQEGLLARSQSEDDRAGVLQTQLREDGVSLWGKMLADAFRIVLQRCPEQGICYGPLSTSLELARITLAAKKMFGHLFWQDLDLDRALREHDRMYVENTLKKWGLNYMYLLHA